MLKHLLGHATWATLLAASGGNTNNTSGLLLAATHVGCVMLGIFVALGLLGRGPLARLFERPKKKPSG